jgi:drug/metabolite transporter (DMT)-like permease
MKHGMTYKDWGLLMACSVLWGGSFFFVEIALQDLPPFTLVFLRVSIAAAALLIAAPILKIKIPRTTTVLSAFFILGLTNNAIPFSLISYGQTQITSGLASIFNATMPIWTVVIAHFWTSDEKITLNRAIGVSLGLAGVSVMIGPELLSEAFVDIANTFAGQLAILAATFSYGLAAVYARRFKLWGIAPMAVATGQLCASTIIMLPIMIIVDEPWTLTMPGSDVWAAIFGIALLSSALTYYLYFKLLESNGATAVSLVTLMIPASAVFLGVFVLGEILEIKHMIGLAIIALGLLAIDGRFFKKNHL